MASDTLPLLGAVLLAPALAFFIAFLVLRGVHKAPLCGGRHARLRESVVWGTPAFALLHLLLAAAMIAVGMRGELQGSRARCRLV